MSERATNPQPQPRRFLRIHLSTALGLMLLFATLLVLNVETGLRKVSMPFKMFGDPAAIWINGDEWMTIRGKGWPFTIEPAAEWWTVTRAQRIAALDAACGLAIMLLSAVVAEAWLRQPRQPQVSRIKTACLATLTVMALISGAIFTRARDIPLSYFSAPPSVQAPSMLDNGSIFNRVGDPRLVAQTAALDVFIVALILLCFIFLSEAATRRRITQEKT